MGHPLGTCQRQVLAGKLMRPQTAGSGSGGYRAGFLHTGGSLDPPNSLI